LQDRAERDVALVHSILAGDQEAFAEIIGAYQRLVAGVAWRYGVPRDEVEDVVSEVFMKAYRQLHRFRPEYAFSTWLYRLAANHVIDHGRRARKERGRSEMPDQITDESADPAGDSESLERTRLLHAAMQDVAEHYRETLFLVYVEGMKVDEAARTLGLPQGTVKTRLMRGREALRRLLVRRHPEYFGD